MDFSQKVLELETIRTRHFVGRHTLYLRVNFQGSGPFSLRANRILTLLFSVFRFQPICVIGGTEGFLHPFVTFRDADGFFSKSI